VAIDPRNLKPADLARLLNSTPLGTVLDERQLYRHRMRAGFRIGDGRRVDLFRYVAWLIEELAKPKVEKARDYEAVKEAAAARNRALSEAGRDIGELPRWLIRSGRRRPPATSGSSARHTSRRPSTYPGRQTT